MNPDDRIWNAFRDNCVEVSDPVAANEPLCALWVYHGQVCNGGHHQYFQNIFERPEEWRLAVTGARSIGADEIAENLSAAIAAWEGHRRKLLRNVFSFAKSAREGEFEDFDDRFFKLEPEFQEAFYAAVVTLGKT